MNRLVNGNNNYYYASVIGGQGLTSDNVIDTGTGHSLSYDIWNNGCYTICPRYVTNIINWSCKYIFIARRSRNIYKWKWLTTRW